MYSQLYDGGEQEPDGEIVGGMPLTGQDMKNGRFKNMVVPFGLHMQPIKENIEDAVDSLIEYTDVDEVIDMNKFDKLFYSVGKDLGISKSRTYKNKTAKNPTK